MLDFLKKVFVTQTSDIEARMNPTPACTFGGYGKVELETWSDGSAAFEAKLKHTSIPDGEKVDVLCDGQIVTTLQMVGGRGKEEIRFTEMNARPELKIGDVAQFQIAGNTIYQGQFQPD